MTVNVTTYRYKYARVYVNDVQVAIMERSPWTGEWCYGLRTEDLGEYGQPTYRPPFTPTRYQTAKAAAKVAVAALNS